MIGRIHGRSHFSNLRSRGIRARAGALLVVFAPAAVDRPCVAFAVGRRIGNAVVRNRCRRQLREAFTSILDEAPDLAPAGHYLVVVDRGGWTYREARAWLTDALESLSSRPRTKK